MYLGKPGPVDATRYTIIYLTLMGDPALVPNAMEPTNAVERIETPTEDGHVIAAIAEVLA
jgi:hypothetical protein